MFNSSLPCAKIMMYYYAVKMCKLNINYGSSAHMFFVCSENDCQSDIKQKMQCNSASVLSCFDTFLQLIYKN